MEEKETRNAVVKETGNKRKLSSTDTYEYDGNHDDNCAWITPQGYQCGTGPVVIPGCISSS